METKTTMVSIKHELRTPINHIVGYSELMMEECDGATEQQMAMLQELNSRGQYLARLVEQVASEATAGSVLPTGSHAEFSAVLEKIREDLLSLSHAYTGKPQMRDLERIQSAVANLTTILHDIRHSA